MAAFMGRFDHPLLAVAYDVANAEFIGEDQVAALGLLEPWLGQVHLSDGTRTSWRHDRAGTGTVRFGDICLALEEIRFRGLRVAEVISSDPLPDMAATLKQLHSAN